MDKTSLKSLTLSIIPDRLAISQLPHDSEIPSWVFDSGFFSITKTEDELSIVCEQRVVPEGVRRVDNWQGFKVEGPLDFSLTGIVSSLSRPLAENGIPIFVVSTFDTDYILVQDDNFSRAKQILGDVCKIAG